MDDYETSSLSERLRRVRPRQCCWLGPTTSFLLTISRMLRFENTTPRRTSFGRIIAGMRDIREAPEPGPRTSTDVLIAEASQVRDEIVESNLNNTEGRPMLAHPRVSNLWANGLRPDTGRGGSHTTIDPVLSLTRAG
jgi:hypothetical protein